MAPTSASTRDRILQQGLDMISTHGLAGVTIGVLAENTGMSKSGVFAHFRSKEELEIELLDHAAHIAAEHVMRPASQQPAGLPRLQALVNNWLGWTSKAGLSGGCPVAAGLFELDDVEGPVRTHVLALEKRWRKLLAGLVREAIDHGDLRADMDVDQFVWELCGIYLSHHASLRFIRDSRADARAQAAFRSLLERAHRRSPQRKPQRQRKRESI